MKNWTRTSLIFLAFSIGACESQAPTAPTSSLTQSGALATGAQGQMTTVTDGGAGDSGIRQLKGGKPCEEGDTRPKCNEEPPDGNDNDKVRYFVNAVAGPSCSDPDNTWSSDPTRSALTHQNGSLNPRWGNGALTVTTKPDDGVGVPLMLMNDAFVVVLADRLKGQPSQIIAVDLYIKDEAFTQHETDRLFISPVPVDSANGFTIPVQRDGVRVYEGKTGVSVGTICVGDLKYTPQQPS